MAAIKQRFPEYDRNLVSGYIRMYCLQSNMKQFVPNGVEFVCLSFYHGIESFKYFNSKFFRVSNNNSIITNIYGAHSTCYGELSIPFDSNGKHIWKFKILAHNGNQWGDIAIGIDESIHKWIDSFFCPQKETLNYGYGSTGVKGNKAGIIKFSQEYTRNDIITMILDLNRNEILFAKNDEKEIHAFDVKPSKIGYSMAICVTSVCDSVSLLSYHWKR